VATHAAVELRADKLLVITGQDVRQLGLPHYLPRVRFAFRFSALRVASRSEFGGCGSWPFPNCPPLIRFRVWLCCAECSPGGWWQQSLVLHYAL